MPKAWSNKRDRQYEHIKDSAKKQGKSTKRAKEIAARTVNKQRGQSGEARASSKSSTKTSSRSKSDGNGGKTREQLYKEAQRLGIPGRSTMNKQQLQRAVSRKK
jgi:hypothetical protein